MKIQLKKINKIHYQQIGLQILVEIPILDIILKHYMQKRKR